MSPTSPAEKPAPNVPPLVDAARQFMTRLKELQVPQGHIRDLLEQEFAKRINPPDATKLARAMKGPRAAILALADFIDQNQEQDAITANKPFVDRAKGEGVKMKITDIIGELTVADKPERLAELEKELRSMLEVRRKNLFEGLELAIMNIAADKKLQIKRTDIIRGIEREESGGSDEPKSSDGSWRDSLKSPDKPDVSDKDIKNSAVEFDKSGAGIDDKGIKKSAQEGSTFDPAKREKSDYEKGEDGGDMEYHMGLLGEGQETREYAQLAVRLSNIFSKTLGKALGQQTAAGR